MTRSDAMIMRSDPAPDALPRTLVRLRAAVLLAAAVVAVAEVRFPIATWPEAWIGTAFFVYRIGWLALLALACAFWRELYRYARAAGGASYAASYLFLSVMLTPLVLGIAWVPRMVADDVAGGQAAWRRERALGFRESALRTALYLLALLVIGVPLWLIEPRLALAAPVLALFLQRLVLPWVRRAPDDDEISR
jgi:hypothetical protein